MEWGAVSAWAAATISASTTCWTLWLRRRDRPEPDWWLLDGLTIEPSVGYVALCRAMAGRLPDRVDKLVNVGNGDAFRVQIEPVGCLAGICDRR
jgi:hypothetical protein